MRIRIFAAAGLAALLGTSGVFAQTTLPPATAGTSPTTTSPTATTPKPHKGHKDKAAAGTAAATTPAATTPAATPASATPATGTAATARPKATASKLAPGTKVNLNTATADQLDALPEVGQARAKVIVTERAKGPFKDWTDFDTRTAHTSVNSGVKAKIKDMVTF